MYFWRVEVYLDFFFPTLQTSEQLDFLQSFESTLVRLQNIPGTGRGGERKEERGQRFSDFVRWSSSDILQLLLLRSRDKKRWETNRVVYPFSASAFKRRRRREAGRGETEDRTVLWQVLQCIRMSSKSRGNIFDTAWQMGNTWTPFHPILAYRPFSRYSWFGSWKSVLCCGARLRSQLGYLNLLGNIITHRLCSHESIVVFRKRKCQFFRSFTLLIKSSGWLHMEPWLLQFLFRLETFFSGLAGSSSSGH